MRARQVVERQVVLENLADFDDIGCGGLLASAANLAEELDELFTLRSRSRDGKTSLTQSPADKAADFLARVAQRGSLCVAALLAFIGTWEEVGEETQSDRKEKLRERDKDEDRERNETAEILDGTLELNRCELLIRTG